MTLARAVFIRWGGLHHLAAQAGSTALVRSWDGPIQVPGRDDVRALVTPLVPVLVALVAADGSRTSRRDLERLGRIGDQALRAGYCLVVLGSVALLAVSGLPADRLVLARNGLLFAGVGIGGACVLPAAAAWPPLVLLPMVTWLLGSRGLGAPPAPWAVLLHPAGSVPAWTVAVLAASAALGWYVWAPANPRCACSMS